MTQKTEPVLQRIKSSVLRGLGKGWTGWCWLMKIIVPISLATALLVHFGIIYRLGFLFEPMMNMIGLPATAVLPIIIGLFTGIYGAVAAMAVIPLSMTHMTLIAVFLLISHNIIQESIVQGRSGINPFFAGGFRLFMSVVVTFACSRAMGSEGPVAAAAAVSGGAAGLGPVVQPFSAMIALWAVDILKLGIKIFCIIMPLMVILDLAKTFSLIQFITRMTFPVLKILGLSRSTGLLWLTASFFGLAYGAAVIVEETKTNAYTQDELIRLHLSIGINHAIIEDPILFLPLGLPPFWLWVPRFIAAIAATYVFFLISSARRLYVKRACHKKLCNHR